MTPFILKKGFGNLGKLEPREIKSACGQFFEDSGKDQTTRSWDCRKYIEDPKIGKTSFSMIGR